MNAPKKTTAAKAAKPKTDVELIDTVVAIVEELTAQDGELTEKGRATVRQLAENVVREMPNASARELAIEVARREDAQDASESAATHLSEALDDMRDDLFLIELALGDKHANVSELAARAIARARERLEAARRSHAAGAKEAAE
jgi:broad specificity phosphatase PhoE